MVATEPLVDLTDHADGPGASGKPALRLLRPPIDGPPDGFDVRRLDAPEVDQRLLERLARIHGISAEAMTAQVAIIREAMEGLTDRPRSYANVIERTEDIKRAALWLLAGANSQAEFRRYFGTARHLQPSKSVAWSIFHRVFKRNV